MLLQQIASTHAAETLNFIQYCQAYRDIGGIEICSVTSSNISNSNDIKSAIGVAMTPHLPSGVDYIYMHWQRAY